MNGGLFIVVCLNTLVVGIASFMMGYNLGYKNGTDDTQGPDGTA